jgi:protein CMS1
MSDSEPDKGIPLLEPEFASDTISKKRKSEIDADATADQKRAAKKAKRKEKKKQKVKAIDENELDEELHINHAFEKMDSQLLTDYINSRTRLYGKDLSSVELEDQSISGRLPRANISALLLTGISETC